jgi:hypothetical protein
MRSVVQVALNVPNTGGQTSVTVNQNNTLPLSATAVDQYGKILTGLALDFLSTTPMTIPATSTGAITPTFPGIANYINVIYVPSSLY